MSIARLPVIKEWLESWLLLARNSTFVLASGLVDMVFFIAYGFLTAPVFDKLAEHVIVIREGRGRGESAGHQDQTRRQ